MPDIGGKVLHCSKDRSHFRVSALPKISECRDFRDQVARLITFTVYFCDLVFKLVPSGVWLELKVA
jgi:hypothetical protein